MFSTLLPFVKRWAKFLGSSLKNILRQNKTNDYRENSMKKSILNPISTMLLIAITNTLLADLSPTAYAGWTLSPYQEKEIVLTREKVDIYWGEFCRVEAVFELNNPKSNDMIMKIGFPTRLNHLGRFTGQPKDSINRIYDFAFVINGDSLMETDVPNIKEPISDNEWYGWTCNLKPKLNKIHLSYKVKNNPSYGHFWKRNIHYVLYTGKYWKGNIDYAEVVFHFPDKLNNEQILERTSPAGYEKTDSTMRWVFRDFKPTRDSNIHLEIIDFQTYSQICNYQKALKSGKVSNKNKLNAAIFYAELAPYKGIDLYMPTRFDFSYFNDTILPNLTESEKKIFLSTFKLHENSKFGDFYFADGYDGFQLHGTVPETILSVMYRIGYFSKVRYPIIFPLIENSKKLFREVLESEPNNAAAWKAWLNLYFRIEPEGCHPCRMMHWKSKIALEQEEIIKMAYENCKSDPEINLWYSLVSPENAVLPDTLGKFEEHLGKAGIWIKTTETGLGFCQIEPKEFNTVKQKYKVFKDGFLIKSERQINDKEKRQIIDILYKCHYFQYKFCRDLKAMDNSK